MQKRNICVIDNEFPTKNYPFLDKALIIRAEMLEVMLDKDTWGDSALQNLTRALLDTPEWEMSASLHPDRFLKAAESIPYAPEIIVFDWDFGGSCGGEQAKRLHDILSKTYSLVIVYSNIADLKIETVKREMGAEKFSFYANRFIDVMKKGDEAALGSLLDKAKAARDTNFSLKFGADLRRKVQNSLEELLIQFGRFTEYDLVSYLGEEIKSESKKVLSESELVELISAKLRNSLAVSGASSLDLQYPSRDADAKASPELLNELWAYRSFYFPKDDLVRKGDIVRQEGAGSDVLWLVLTSDCHMKDLANKNLGILTLIPMYRISSANERLKSKLKSVRAGKRKDVAPSSLVNVSKFERTAILSSIKLDGNYDDYLLLPYEACNIELPTVACPKYPVASYSRCCSVSEPFLTTLVNHILASITHYGAPDYPTVLRDRISEKFKSINDALQ